MEIFYPNSNRIGRFRILYTVLEEDRQMCGALFALCRSSEEHPYAAMLCVEPHESGRGVEYTAACPLFDELKEGEEIPEYRIEFAYDRPFENPEWEARRKESGKFRFAAFRNIIVRVPPATVGVRPQTGMLH
jgi:hypothetical protein